ncbi:MAG: hypothetical protein FJZ01_04805, partial [Candidatus Sericytochromatia bacterium]|nr:hypothetical protein [Candidatus Tanganyikabacteria bacterium]
MRGRTLRRLLAAGLAGTVSACGRPPAPTGVEAPRADSLEIQQLAEQIQFDDAMLGMLPPSVPGDAADRFLMPLAPDEISAAFEPSRFAGREGTYVGFAPGMSVSMFATTRFLRAGDLFLPYRRIGDRWAPYCFSDVDRGFFFFPAFTLVAGVLVPIFHVRLIPVITIPVVFVVTVPVVFVSPVLLVAVPPPIFFRPILYRPIPIVPLEQVAVRVRTLEVAQFIRPAVVLPPPLVRRVRERIAVRQDIADEMVVQRLRDQLRAEREMARDIRRLERLERITRERAGRLARAEESLRLAREAERRAAEAERRLRDRADLREQVERRIRERQERSEARRGQIQQRQREREQVVEREAPPEVTKPPEPPPAPSEAERPTPPGKPEAERPTPPGKPEAERPTPPGKPEAERPTP